MPLSTSSFERPLPDSPWLKIFGASLLITFVFIILMEIRLAQLGYHTTVLDSADRWAQERARASELGDRALILIGGSRIQLGIDIDTLRKKTGLEPVQLAVDGSSFIPVLQELADDPTIQGLILADYYSESVSGALSGEYGAAKSFVQTFKQNRHENEYFSLTRAEEHLAKLLHENLRSFADGATPLSSLQWRIVPNEKAGQYLVTLSDRSRLANYNLVAMPEFYYSRVARNLGLEREINPVDADTEPILRQRINSLRPQSNAAYVQGARYINQLANTINSRGGSVIFVAMPTSGMIREIDERRHPRQRFLDIFEKETGVPIYNSADIPAMQSFTCPDGSHLDLQDRTAFTIALANSLNIDR